MEGAQPGLTAIIKIRVESAIYALLRTTGHLPIIILFRVPLNHQDLEPPKERAKYVADGLRPFNGYTEQECNSLETLTAAHCTVTPELLSTKSVKTNPYSR